MAGYNEMLRLLESEKIICYNTPFPEMQGDIVFVDYGHSSWRYMNYERSYKADDLDAFKIGRQLTVIYDTITPFIDVPKGGGSTYGGQCRPSPNKPQDQRFVGDPSETKISYTTKGELIETHIVPDRKADYEIHHTDHGFPKYHEVSHEHKVIWDDSGPHLSHEEYLVKQYSGRIKMSCLLLCRPTVLSKIVLSLSAILNGA